MDHSDSSSSQYYYSRPIFYGPGFFTCFFIFFCLFSLTWCCRRRRYNYNYNNNNNSDYYHSSSTTTFVTSPSQPYQSYQSTGYDYNNSLKPVVVVPQVLVPSPIHSDQTPTLEGLTKCNICLDRVSDAVLLECGHSVSI